MPRFCVKGVLVRTDTPNATPITGSYLPAGPTRLGAVTPTWSVQMGVTIGIASAGPPIIFSQQIVTYLVAGVDALAAIAAATALAVADYPTAAPVAGAAFQNVPAETPYVFEFYDIMVDAANAAAAVTAAAAQAGTMASGAIYKPLSAVEVQ